MLTLYTYFRSSSAYRVRIALNLKQLSYQRIPVHLTRDGGQQFAADYRARNPTQLVPTLLDDAITIPQSLAIIEYLEEVHPTPPLLPGDAAARARIRAIAQHIACEIHPLNNLRVLQYLKKQLKLEDEQRNEWYRHWVGVGLTAVEALLREDPRTGTFCHGDTPTLADCCLVPQVFNAHRLNCDMDAYPIINRINATCLTLPEFQQAAPGVQIDAE